MVVQIGGNDDFGFKPSVFCWHFSKLENLWVRTVWFLSIECPLVCLGVSLSAPPPCLTGGLALGSLVDLDLFHTLFLPHHLTKQVPALGHCLCFSLWPKCHGLRQCPDFTGTHTKNFLEQSNVNITFSGLSFLLDKLSPSHSSSLYSALSNVTYLNYLSNKLKTVA